MTEKAIIDKLNELSQQRRVLKEPYNGLRYVDYIVEMEERTGTPMTPETIEKAAHYIAKRKKIDDQITGLFCDYYALARRFPVKYPDGYFRAPEED